MTAVEWFALQLYENFEMKGDGDIMNGLLNQAKEIEKQQKKQIAEIAFDKGVSAKNILTDKSKFINEVIFEY